MPRSPMRASLHRGASLRALGPRREQSIDLELDVLEARNARAIAVSPRAELDPTISDEPQRLERARVGIVPGRCNARGHAVIVRPSGASVTARGLLDGRGRGR